VLQHVIASDGFNSAENCPAEGTSRFGGEDGMAEFTLERDILTRFVLGTVVHESISEVMLVHALGH
jgi:hypothetical protein